LNAALPSSVKKSPPLFHRKKPNERNAVTPLASKA
jgi:hypothetical protein